MLVVVGIDSDVAMCYPDSRDSGSAVAVLVKVELTHQPSHPIITASAQTPTSISTPANTGQMQHHEGVYGSGKDLYYTLLLHHPNDQGTGH